MDKLKAILRWCKSNYIPVACIVVAVASFGAFGWGWTKSAAFKESLKKRESELSKIQKLQNTRIEVPPADINDQPFVETTVVNQPRIDELKKIYDQIDGEYDGVAGFMVRYNQYGPQGPNWDPDDPNWRQKVDEYFPAKHLHHNAMLKGLFPEYNPRDLHTIFLDAQKAYVKRLTEIDNRLEANLPWDKDRIREEMERQKRLYLARNSYRLPEKLNNLQQNEMNKEVALQMKRFFKEHAIASKIFAPPFDIEAGVTSQKRDLTGPYPVMDWIWYGENPKMETVWEGQMQLWILQDIVEAIRLANNMDDPDASLVTGPIKMLDAIEIVPGYIGLDANQPSKTLDENARKAVLEKGLPLDPRLSITGRQSNPLYDVRHARVHMLVDYNRLPEIFNAFSQVNFMTIIAIEKLQNNDDYKALREGLYFGETVDTWNVTLLVETIWMRDWTVGSYMTKEEAEKKGVEFVEGLMPYSVRLRFGLPIRGSDPGILKQEQDDSVY